MNTNMQALMNMQDEGFLQANQETLEMLTKAMTAGSGVDAASFTGGRALSLESLDQTLVNILFSQDEAVLFQRLKKQTVKSPVHQWDERTAVGLDDGAWVPEGGDSVEGDQTIARKFVTAKYLQTKRVVTMQASMTNMIEDAVALEENAGTLWLIRNVEKALFYGDNAVVAEQPDGLKKLIPSTHVIDMRGKAANSSEFEDSMTEACRMVRDYYGRLDLMLTSTRIMQDVQGLLRDRIRFPTQQSGLGGAVFNQYPTPFGSPDLKEDIFIKESTTPLASSLTTLRPAQPTVASGVNGAGSNSQFGSGDAGVYYYKVVAVNKYGDSLASADVGPITVAAGEIVTITVNAPGDSVSGYKLYRSKLGAADGSDTRFCFQQAAVSPVAQNILIDRNADLPGCSDTFLLTTSPTYNAIEWAQFLPMMKFNLYPTASAVIPFLMLLFGALALKKPVNHVRVKNISPASLGWYA